MAKRKRAKEELEFGDLSKYFEVTVEDAARCLHRTPLQLRSRCKELGFHWPRGDIERYRKQVKLCKELRETKIQSGSSETIINTLTKQIEEANSKIQLLYKNPIECTDGELKLRNIVSHPYKRRNQNNGVLTESEKERYRALFSCIEPHTSQSFVNLACSSTALCASTAFFDKDLKLDDIDNTPNNNNLYAFDNAMEIVPTFDLSAEFYADA